MSLLSAVGHAARSAWKPDLAGRVSQFLRNVPLQVRAFSTFSLGTMLLVALFLGIGLSSVRSSIERTLEERLALAQLAADHIDLELANAYGSIERSLAWAMESLDPRSPTFADDLLVSLQGNMPFPAVGTFFVSTSGTEVAALADSRLMAEAACWDASFVRNVVSMERPRFFAYTCPLEGPELLVWVSVPVGGPAKPMGFVVAATQPNYVEGVNNILGVLGPGSTGYAEMISDTGRVLASSRSDSTPTESDHAERFAQLIREGRTTRGTCHSCHTDTSGQQRDREVLAFAPLKQTDWGVTLHQSEDEALLPARNLKRFFLGFGGAMLAGGMALSWFMTRGLVRPLKELAVASDRIAEGNLGDPVPTRGPAEVGVLAAAFERMRYKLKRSVEEIREWNRTLEERVHNRTRELLALNAVSGVVNQGLDLEVMLNAVVEKVRQELDAEGSWVFLGDEGQEGSGLLVQRGLSPEDIEWLRRQGQMDAGPVARRARHVVATLRLGGKSIGHAGIVVRDPRQDGANLDSLLEAIGNQIAVAAERCRLYQEARRVQEIRGQLLRKVITAQEDERKRLARELHDETAQDLTALNVSLQRLSLMPSGGNKDEKAALESAIRLGQRAEDDIDRLIGDLRPTMLDDLGLAEATEWCARARLEGSGVVVSVRRVGAERRLPAEIETALFRVLQEAISNVARHARAKNLRISLVFKDSQVAARVADDGVGFSVDLVLKSGVERKGLGLLGMKERVSLVGGTLEIRSRPGSGTRIRAVVPL